MGRTNSKKKVVVGIPLYKEKPDQEDIISLQQCFRILGNHDIVIVAPLGLDLKEYPFSFSEVIRFDKKYFRDVQGYNELLMSDVFYERFLTYDYLLVYQTDAFVFKDELEAWCRLNYDYIGAPWFYKKYPDLVKMLKERIKGWYHRKLNIRQKENDVPTDQQTMNMVGNGGFSLRRVGKFYELCFKKKKQIASYLAREEHYFNEDVFWSIEVNRYGNELKIPNYKKALEFSIENSPKMASEYINNKLPFGCHAWNNYKDFWRPVFAQYGYEI